MDVYFSASSSTLTEDRSSYNLILEAIEKAGGRIVSNWIEDKTKLDAEDLFEQTIIDIKKSELLVAEITHPSTGVGQQIAMALSWKIPVIALKRSDVNHDSRFTLGTKSPYLKIINYDKKTLIGQLTKGFEDIKKSKYVKFNFITTREINDFLEEKSEEKGVSKSELLREIVETWKKNNS